MPAKGNEMNAHFLSTRLTILLCKENVEALRRTEKQFKTQAGTLAALKELHLI